MARDNRRKPGGGKPLSGQIWQNKPKTRRSYFLGVLVVFAALAGLTALVAALSFFINLDLRRAALLQWTLPRSASLSRDLIAILTSAWASFQISGGDSAFGLGYLGLGGFKNGLIALRPSLGRTHLFFCSFGSRQMNLLKYVTYVILSFFLSF